MNIYDCFSIVLVLISIKTVLVLIFFTVLRFILLFIFEIPLFLWKIKIQYVSLSLLCAQYFTWYQFVLFL